MKHTVNPLLVSLLVGLSTLSLACPPTPHTPPATTAPVVNIPGGVPVVSTKPPIIDGVLVDPAWKTAMVFDSFKTPDGSVPKGHARMLITQDSQNLYIAIESFEDAQTLSSLVAKVKQNDGADMWADDEIEFFIDPSNRRQSYYHIAVNSKGVTWDAYHAEPGKQGSIPDTSWNPTYKSAARVGPKSWVVELALPWSSFDSTPKFASDWAFDVLVMRQSDDARQKAEEEMWFAPIKGNANQPAKFGMLHGMTGSAPAKIVERKAVIEKKPDPTTEPWFPKFEARKFTSSDGTVLLYRMVRPANATPSVKTPLFIYLHGSGLRGSNNIDQAPEFREATLEAAEKYNALSIVPQCPTTSGWVFNASSSLRRPGATQTSQAASVPTQGQQSNEPLRLIIEMLPSLQKEFNLDMDRVYISGGSMGAAGVWTMLDAYPDMFAAALLRCGRGDVGNAAKFIHTPLWLFHGDKDKAVPVQGSRDMIAALRKAGGTPRYTEYPGRGHLDLPLDAEVLPWVFAQRKSATSKPTTTAPAN